MNVKTKMADISLISRVRTRRNNSKNSKKTIRRATSAIWRILNFVELNNPKCALLKMNLISMEVSMFELSLKFLN